MDDLPGNQHDTTSAPINIADKGNYLPPVNPKRIVGGLLKLVLAVIVLAAILVGVFMLVAHSGSKKPVPAQEKPANLQPSSVTKISAAIKHYDSTNYSLGFDYPKDWKLTDNADKLTVVSPPLQLKDATEQVVTGQIVFTIQAAQTTIAQFAANTAVAAIASQKISYKQPTPNQRAETYVSFVNYKGDTTSIDALYLAGDNGYQAGQYIPQSDVVKADPLVNVSFLKCSESTCTTAGTAISIPVSSWSDTSLSTPLLTMLKSLVID
jgi:hypothetical protein